MTTSAPCSTARENTGVAKTLSTTTRAPAAWAMALMAAGKATEAKAAWLQAYRSLSDKVDYRRLVEAKGMVEHGQWGEWLEKSVDYSTRTAQNLMKIFEEYGADQIPLFGDNAKTQAIADLTRWFRPG